MCGIAGMLTRSRPDEGELRGMLQSIAHRGPDDEGAWLDQDAGVALGHRRLSIVDLSPSGRQPMISASGRFVLILNGEIYNHAELRTELEATGQAPEGGWRGRSDTETFLEAVAAWGLEDALARSTGMFAFALWDRQRRILSLVRDRFGEKPLYYGWVGGDFAFASELKALRAHPRFANPIDRQALHLFASRTWIRSPLSIYESLFKLPPAAILEVTFEAVRNPRSEALDFDRPEGGLSLRRYWSYRELLLRGLDDPIEDEADAVEAVDEALSTAIRGQSMADVPVGAFLSGGIDSSTVIALYQRHSSLPVRTYSIGFEEAAFNEAEDAREVARHLGTIHHEHVVTVQEARDVIPLLPSMYDEPFADSSQIPTYLVSRFARRDVTVALTGDGGDELFAGYNRHFAAPSLWQQLQSVPPSVRSLIASTLGRLPARFWSGAAAMLPGRRPPNLGGKIQKALRIAGSARTFDEVYESFLDEWNFEPSPVLGRVGTDPLTDSLPSGMPDALRVMYRDAIGYLPDDILCKVDRAAMAVSLETRVPFLDHRVAEVAARIPLDLKIRDGKGKHVLRQLLYRHVPASLFDRPKAGFAVPVGEWIKGSLRGWAEDLLDPRAMRSEGWFDAELVRRRWQAHLSGSRDCTNALWAVLMFQAWLREQQDRVAAAA